MDLKITLLFLLIAAIIGLSYLNEANMRRARRLLFGRRWRPIMLLRRRI
jgi:hypothetical protein